MMDEHKQKFAGAFDRIASTYDRVGPQSFSYFGGRLVDIAQPGNGSRVLDVGTGRGAVLFPAAKFVGRGGRVVGIDLSEGMVKETAEEAKREGMANVEVQLMDAENLRFPDASFDVVLCGFSLFYLPHLAEGLSEFHRVMKPGGKLAASFFRGTTLGSRLRQLVSSFLPPQERLRGDERLRDVSLPTVSTVKPADFDTTMLQAGFVGMRDIAEEADFVFSSEDEWWSMQWSRLSRYGLETIERLGGPGALGRFKAAAFEMLQEHKQPDGIHDSIRVLFTVATKPGLG